MNRRALQLAAVSPSKLSMVGAHGTGTALGDPIEVESLAAAYGGSNRDSAADPALVLGAVKSNVGHLETASGMAGLIKLVMPLEHRFVPGCQPAPAGAQPQDRL